MSQDTEGGFAGYEFPNGTIVHNSEHESDGTFRRMMTTPKGLRVFNKIDASTPPALTDQDREGITRWKPHLLALVAYCDESPKS